MKKLTGGLLQGLIIAAFSCILTYLITNSKERNENQMRYLDKWINISHTDIPNDKLQETKIQITYNGKPIKGISTIKVQLYNFSDKDFAKVPVYVEIIPQEGDSLQLVNSQISGANGLKQTIKSIDDSSKPFIKGSIHFIYNMEITNRTDSINDPCFNALYDVISNKAPTIKVSLAQDGLALRDYGYEHFEKTPWWESDLAIILYVVIGFILYIMIIIRATTYFSLKRGKRFRAYLIEGYRKKIDSEELGLDAEKIVDYYTRLNDVFDYNTTWPFIRWLSGTKRPDDL